MISPPEVRKPASSKTGSREVGKAVRNSITLDTPPPLDLQAQRVRSMFPALSWPLARCVAELAFSTGRAA